MLLQQNKGYMSIVYTCNTYSVMLWSMYLFREYLVNGRIQYIYCKIRETDKLLLGVFTQLFVWNTQMIFKQAVSRSEGFIEYPIKIVDVT